MGKEIVNIINNILDYNFMYNKPSLFTKIKKFFRKKDISNRKNIIYNNIVSLHRYTLTTFDASDVLDSSLVLSSLFVYLEDLKVKGIYDHKCVGSIGYDIDNNEKIICHIYSDIENCIIKLDIIDNTDPDIESRFYIDVDHNVVELTMVNFDDLNSNEIFHKRFEDDDWFDIQPNETLVFMKMVLRIYSHIIGYMLKDCGLGYLSEIICYRE